MAQNLSKAILNEVAEEVARRQTAQDEALDNEKHQAEETNDHFGNIGPGKLSGQQSDIEPAASKNKTFEVTVFVRNWPLESSASEDEQALPHEETFEVEVSLFISMKSVDM